MIIGFALLSSVLAAFLSAAIKRWQTIIWLTLVIAYWGGIYWLFAASSFTVRYGYGPFGFYSRLG